MSLDEELRLCLDEALEHLDACDHAAMALDLAADGHEPPIGALAELFRGVHTIKGNAGMLGLDALVEIAHALETILDRMRSGKLAPDRDRIDLLFGGLDALRTVILSLHRGVASNVDHRSVATSLLATADGPSTPAAPGDWAARFPGWRLAPAEAATIAAGLAEGTQHLYRLEMALPDADPGDPIAHPALEKLLALGRVAAWCSVTDGRWWIAYASGADQAIIDQFGPEELVSCEQRPDGRMPAPPRSEAESVEETAPAAPMPAAEAEGSVRVGVALLDRLMNLVGELVLTRNLILQGVQHGGDDALAAPVQRLDFITGEIQEAVMRTRMQPIGQLWEKFPRLIRDYCRQTGKQVDLVADGAETELDKSLLEAIKDPLTHLLRNALDHGVEAPAARAAAGKAAAGTIRLSAFQDGGRIVVEIRDDGRGLDYARIRAKALTAGLMGAEALARMGEAELAQLVFQPGFSTAEAVTDISGRGVGMDVVKNNIEQAGGTVELASEPGSGTTCRLTVPLTLVVIPALVVHVADERFTLPLSTIREVVRSGNEGGARVERLHDAVLLRLRDELLPVVDVQSTLGRAPEAASARPYFVVVAVGQQTLALAIDAIGNPEEIVVKPLPAILRTNGAFSGVTIMGDGDPCLILDVAGLAARANILGGAAAMAPRPIAAVEAERAAARPMLAVALEGRRYAVPMSLVVRLEEFAGDRLEAVGSRQLVHYGQHLLPVADPRLALGLPAATSPGPGERILVVVVGDAARPVGIRVDAIHDVVDAQGAVQAAPGVPGVAGTAVLDGRATDVLDVAATIEAALPGWLAAGAGLGAEALACR